MTTWTKKLLAHGESKRKPKAMPRKPRPVLQETGAQIRGASGNDPGEVIPVYYLVDDGVLIVMDEKGKPLEGAKAHTLLSSDHAQQLAKLMTLVRRRQADPNGFNRSLNHGRWCSSA
jgi:hypothetical protein